jgi:cellulose synthase/poly-beta-1,6-N-acetylglucosamine synthase-like glycosyltransferase
MPCYNVAATVDETLSSLAVQTLEDFEVLCVDDGSDDVTLDILKTWAARDSRFRVLSCPHRGIIPALNEGLAASRAAYVARLDADDLAPPERLALQVAYLDQHPEVDLVSSLVEAFPKDQVREGFQIYIQWLNSLVTHEEIQREIYVESPMAHPSITFRKAAVQQVGGYQEYGWPEDYDLWLRMHLAGKRFAKIPKVLLKWREHEQRLTRTDSRYSVENFLRAKARYLAQGPMAERDAIIIWGAGMMGRRLSKHLMRSEGLPVVAFVDIDPKKIGNTRRGKPIIAPDELLDWWSRYQKPAVLAAVGARGARHLIRERLLSFELSEGQDWWAVA